MVTRPGIRLVEVFRYNDDLAVERYELPNGLTVLFLPDHQAPLFSYQTWFKVGSRHEVAGRTGIAHLFEHLMFKGTTNLPEGEFDRRLESVGARVNAATWLDWTFYYEDAPKAYLAEVIRLDADRMENLALCTEKLEAERPVVMNERRERVDNDPGGRLSERLWHAAYGDEHPYGHPTIGWMPDIEAITLEDCQAFYRTWYAPNNATVVVAGDVERDELLDEIVKAYGHLPAQPLPEAPAVPETLPALPLTLEEQLPLSADRLLCAFRGPAVTAAEHAALEALSEIVAEGDSARLQRALVTDGELAAGFYASTPAFALGGLYEIAVDLRPGRTAEEALEALLRVLDDVQQNGVTEAELAKAKNRMETRFYRGLQTGQQRAQSLGFWATTAADYRLLFTIAERYRTVTLEDVAEVARKLLVPENRITLFGRPSGELPEDLEESEEG